MSYQFIIPGLPRAKQRPRLGKYGNVYTPQETKKYEEEIWVLARQAGLRPNCLKDKSLDVRVVAIMGPKTTDLLRIDGDNLLKVVLDGLRPAFDDAWVIHQEVTKFCGTHPEVLVVINVL